MRPFLFTFMNLYDSKKGYEVSSAFSVREAEALFDVIKSDLVIGDVHLQDKSGLYA